MRGGGEGKGSVQKRREETEDRREREEKKREKKRREEVKEKRQIEVLSVVGLGEDKT